MKKSSTLSCSTTKRRPVPAVAMYLAIALLGGCASGSLSNMWRDPSFQSGPMKNILVIAVRTDPVRRRLWEDGFVAEISKHGVTAIPSYQLFPDALPDTEQCVAAIRANGYDGVLVTRRLGVDTVNTYVPGYTGDTTIVRYNRMAETYFTYYRRVQVPGYTETELTARHEVDVWTTKGLSRMVWSAVGGIVQTGSKESVNQEIAGLIVPELAKQGIIPGEK